MPGFPPEGSTVASSVDLLFLVLVGLAFFFLFLVASLIAYFAIKYRRRSPIEIPKPLAGSNRLEFMWTVIPLGLTLAVFFWAARLYLQMIQPPANALEIYVVGKEWMWQFEHADGQKEIDELHVPVGQPIKLTMISQDVIHSFYVPAFRVKQDVLPERYTVTAPAGITCSAPSIAGPITLK
jgi:cytochrome c oxidase subunit 2